MRVGPDGWISSWMEPLPDWFNIIVLYGCETWSLTFREERRLRVFENRVLRRIFGPRRDEVRGECKNYILRSLIHFTPYPILFG